MDALHNCLVNNKGEFCKTKYPNRSTPPSLGFADTNVEMDLVVEHFNLVLKTRLEALGGRYTEEAIERIGASLTLADLLEEKLFPTYTLR